MIGAKKKKKNVGTIQLTFNQRHRTQRKGRNLVGEKKQAVSSDEEPILAAKKEGKKNPMSGKTGL